MNFLVCAFGLVQTMPVEPTFQAPINTRVITTAVGNGNPVPVKNEVFEAPNQMHQLASSSGFGDPSAPYHWPSLGTTHLTSGINHAEEINPDTYLHAPLKWNNPGPANLARIYSNNWLSLVDKKASHLALGLTRAGYDDLVGLANQGVNGARLTLVNTHFQEIINHRALQGQLN